MTKNISQNNGVGQAKAGDPPVVTNEVVTDGMSFTPPALAGDEIFGTMLAWSGDQGRMYLASDGEQPPYQPVPLNPAWTAFDTPALCLATEWARVYLAWTDPDGGVHLASSGDNWQQDFEIAPAGSANGGPALAFDPDAGRVYVAWRTADASSQLALAAFDKQNGTNFLPPTGQAIYSRPSLAVAPGEGLYALSGSDIDAVGNLEMLCLFSPDGGQTFTQIPLSPNDSMGPPSLVAADGWYYLVWADMMSSSLNFAATQNLQDFTPTTFPIGCHGGGPALINRFETLVVGWTYGAPPEDPRSHHVTVGDLPLSAAPAGQAAEDARERRLRGPRYDRVRQGWGAPLAPNPCPDPLTVYDPSNDKCVPKLGCVGQCVLSSITRTPAGPLFNPIAYGICLWRC